MSHELNLIPRPALDADLDILLEFEQQVVEAERPYNDAIRKSDVTYYDLPALLDDPDVSLQVAEIDGRVIGCGYARLESARQALAHDRQATFGFMYVEPEFRGRGVSAKIMESLFEWGRERGVRHFSLSVYAGNRSAIRAYEKAGFEPGLVEMNLRKPD